MAHPYLAYKASVFALITGSTAALASEAERTAPVLPLSIAMNLSAAAAMQPDPEVSSDALPASVEEAESEDGVSEIIVTANKRQEKLNDVGLTIQAATSATLATRGINDVAALGKLVPGFNATQALYATPVYTLRGIGLYDSTFGGAPSVAIYTDETPRNVPVMSAALDQIGRAHV